MLKKKIFKKVKEKDNFSRYACQFLNEFSG